MIYQELSKPKGIILAALLLAFVIACGAAAPPEPVAEPPAEPQQRALQEVQAAPTSIPDTVAEPEITEPEVHPGTLLVLMGDLSNERFHRGLAGGGVGPSFYGRTMGGFLIQSNRDHEMVPGIASEWSVSPDGQTWTFTTREGVKWHDGTEFTEEDLLWNFQHYFGPHAQEYARYAFLVRLSDKTESVELIGPNQVSVTFTRPVLQLADELSFAGDNWAFMVPKREELWDAEVAAAFDKNPISAGPMRVVEHIPSSVMKFERFDDYYYQPDNGFPEDKRVKFQSMELHLVPEEAARVVALEAGQAHIIPMSLDSKNQVEASGGRVAFSEAGVALYLGFFGCGRPDDGKEYPCDDQRVRQALDYAIPKELMRDTLYSPESFKVKGFLTFVPGGVGYDPGLDPRPFDPEKARQLLADAGYPGGQGFDTMIINVRPAASAPLLVESAQLIADTWRRELGIPVEVRPGEHTGITAKRTNYELDGQVWWRETEVAANATWDLENPFGDITSTWATHFDPELEAQVKDVLQTPDEKERRAKLTPLLFSLKELTGRAGAGYLNIPFGVHPDVLTWEPWPIAAFPTALETITLR